MVLEEEQQFLHQPKCFLRMDFGWKKWTGTTEKPSMITTQGYHINIE
jgi:hypothetical protein